MSSEDNDEIIGDVHVCGNCRGEFVVFADFVKHKQTCIKKQVVMIYNNGPEQMETSEKDQDTASDRSTPEERKSIEPNYVSEGKAQQSADQPGRSTDDSPNSSLPPSNVSLDNLENTPYAVAQFPRESATVPGHPDVVMIQEQLYALQQQHLHQLHMIQSIQHQINHLSAQQQRQQIEHHHLQQQQHQQHHQQQQQREKQHAQQEQQQHQQKQEPKESPTSQSSPSLEEKALPTSSGSPTSSSTKTTSSIPSAPVVPIPSLPGMIHPPHILSPAGAAAASAVQQSALEAMQAAQGRLMPQLPSPFHLPGQKSPFEMLQAHASRHMPANPFGIPNAIPFHEGLLASQQKAKPPNVSVFDPKFSADDPFFRHKCRFCHKVFGSDSALQIHIRSHTGERPFKCNVCGNRFSTKGNLKVHFQRHQSRYPHIQMDVRHHPPTPPLMDQPLQPPSIHQVPIPSIPNDYAKFPFERSFEPYYPSKRSTPDDSEDNQGEMTNRSFPEEDRPEMKHSSSIEQHRGESPISPRSSQAETMSPSDSKQGSPVSTSTTFPSSVFPMVSASGIPTSMGFPFPYFGFPRMPMNGEYGMTPSESSKKAPENPDPSKPETPPSLANLAEAGMRASETSKLQQLVENIEQKITDPNQCVICHRVLSCKSSLQLHYRTHTGERPYKCKICGRPFTTKGNLKTHYAVHRSKGMMAMLHDCPICDKSFTNPLVLQQHLRLHAADGMINPESMDDPRPAELEHLTEEERERILQMEERDEFGDDSHMDVDERNDLPTPEEGEVPEDSFNDVDKPENGTLPSEANSPRSDNQGPVNRPPVDEREKESQERRSFMPGVLGLQPVSSSQDDSQTVPSPGEGSGSEKKGAMSEDENRNINMAKYHMHGPESVTSTYMDEEMERELEIDDSSNDFNGPLDLRPRGMPQENIPPFSRELDLSRQYPREGGFPEDMKPTMTSAGLLMNVGEMSLSSRRPMRTNTTCHFCGKVFACASALNIHYRSHTKERPFRCDICSKGFSTKGNLKQHMLTHKIRDMPMPRYDSPLGSQPGSQPMLPRSVSPSMSPIMPPILPKPPSQELPLQQTTSTNSQTPPLKRSLSASPPEDSAKRTQLRHSCSVCGKQFQTNSALEIHMRTHTGEKPFRCHICSRAFTTKGNLKVHLGTHMWNGGGGRRGRRIAVEPPFIVSPKEGEIFRGDMFGMHPGFAEGALYHYPHPHLLNGFGASASVSKANEISVIQQSSSLHPSDPASVIMRNSLAPSMDRREPRPNHGGDSPREMSLSRDEALNHEIAYRREEALSREMAMKREDALTREMAMKREDALTREMAMKREDALTREIAMKREEALNREMAMKHDEALTREIAMKREEAMIREMALKREEALSQEMALKHEEALSRELAIKRELAQNKEMALERANERTPPLAPQISS